MVCKCVKIFLASRGACFWTKRVLKRHFQAGTHWLWFFERPHLFWGYTVCAISCSVLLTICRYSLNEPLNFFSCLFHLPNPYIATSSKTNRSSFCSCSIRNLFKPCQETRIQNYWEHSPVGSNFTCAPQQNTRNGGEFLAWRTRSTFQRLLETGSMRKLLNRLQRL